jgi:DinB family protein
MNPSATPALYRLDRPISRSQVIDELAAMPARLRKALAGVSDEAMTRKPAPSEWSAFETVGHLRDATLVYAIRFRYIIFNDDPFLPDYDENSWAAASRDTVTDIPEILDQIAASRADLVRVLSRLPDEAWRRGGRHEVIGPVVLEDYARHQVVHEEMHLAQLAAAAV